MSAKLDREGRGGVEVGKRSGRSKRRSKPRLILMVGVILLVAGFVTRRTLLPRVLFLLTHRPPASRSQTEVGAELPAKADDGENLNEADRMQLEKLIRERTRRSAERSE